MRRLLVVAAVLFAAAALFADDARVLPQGVGRARVTATYATASRMFDDSGDRVDIGFGPLAVPVDRLTAFNIGAALEYGIIEGVNLAAQWVPGYNVSSTIDADPPLDKAHINGAYDLFVGARAQILGDHGLASKSDTMRFAAAAGAIVPLPGADFDDEADNAAAGEDFIVTDPDKHVFGVGGRASFDYVLAKNADRSDRIYLNLYSELVKYFKRDLKRAPGGTENEWDFGYKLTVEFEPHFEMPVAEGMVLRTGLPLTWVMQPESKMDGTGMDDESYLLTIRPKASLLLTKTVLPLEFEASYLYPLAGKNEQFALNAIAFQAIAYFKL